jgi:tetratricopeptide (TPR) repeat protein
VLYARQFLWPQWLSSDYSFDVIPVVRNGADPRLWAAALFTLGLLGLFVWGCRHSRLIAIAVATWILFLLPTSNLFFAIGTVMGERLAYLASLGGCLALGHLGASLVVPRADGLSARTRLAVLIALLSLLLLSLSVRTIVRNPAWRDNATLTRADARTYPRSAKLQAGAGIALFVQDELGATEEAFRRAVEIYPDYGQIQYNLGVMLSNRGANEEAIEHLSRALLIAPHHPGPPTALRELLEKDDLSPEARSRIQALLESPPS